MGNLMLGIPFGGQRGFGIRPYGVAGVGVIHADSDALGTILNVSDYKIGWDFGGGVMMFFATHVGIRADVRYFRTFQAVDLLNIDIGDGSRKLDFARGSMGLILRF
jgi:opacity protein-like surface antigen